MLRFAPVVLATLLAASAPARARAQNASQPRAQAQAPTPFTVPPATGHFTDPANLAGERPNPRTGRELPIDGGIGPNGQPDNALGLAQMLRKLNTRASLLLIVAHPDDEDGGMLAYYSRGLGARVGVLTLNRGEGGQNQMTGDFEDALGLLRTQELLSADRYMGVDTQMFGTEVDFGFTKTKAEAFQKWNHERVLYDAVRAVRIFRPLVIASVFEGAVTDGHGQHQVAGEITQEVFKAAGDPNVFPELTKGGILPWQPLKVYARVPFARVTAQGLYDYATGQTVPAEFTNYVTGQKFTTGPTADVTINEGADDPLLSTCAANPADLPSSLRSTNCEPLSYVQFARIGLGLQRSQISGGDRVSRPGRVDVGYHLYGSRICAPGQPSPTPKLCDPQLSKPEPRGKMIVNGVVLAPSAEAQGNSINAPAASLPNFFDGIDTSLEGIAALAPANPSLRNELAGLEHELFEADRSFNPRYPTVCAERLVSALHSLELIQRFAPHMGLTEKQADDVMHELAIKHAQLNDAIVLALGLNFDAHTPRENALLGDAVPVETTLSQTSEMTLHSVQESLTSASGKNSHQPPAVSNDGVVARFATYTQSFVAAPTQTSILTRPYFDRKNIEQPVYEIRNPDLRLAAQSPPALTAWADIEVGTATVRIGRIVHSGTQPLEIIPPVSLTLDRHAQVVPDGTHSLTIDVHAETEDHPQGELRLHAPTDWTIRSPQRPLRAGLETFSASLPAHPQTATLKAEATISGTTYTEGFRPVGYGTLPRTNFYTPATLRTVPADLKLPPLGKRRIAYLPGTGDDVPAALASIGLAPIILKVSDLTPTILARFDTVILGVRTYNAHPDLHGAPTQALLDFARNGGDVVVQYQTPEFTAADAPYPLVDHNERVIDETTPVQILDPSSPLLTTPNKITEADFNGWIEERGHGFLDSWDPHYNALTETHDPGAPAEHILPQAPQRGGLITVQLGKGHWTYCAFALYRQLPEAVPGAFRIFVNLLNP